MTIKEIKNRMKDYRDPHRDGLFGYGIIDEVKTKIELYEIIRQQRAYLYDAYIESETNLSIFQESIFPEGEPNE